MKKEYPACPQCSEQNSSWVQTCDSNAIFYYCLDCKVYFKNVLKPVECLGCSECRFDGGIFIYGRRPILDKPTDM
jgi:DNA-directed RNA polymerase subunit RPC12/RpoP